jgi:nucleoside-diphosphate-sugar epimerase
MKIHVTGGKGFLGSYIVPLLRELHQVEVSDRETMDVTDFRAVKYVLGRSQPDVICHLAALCGAGPSRERPQEFFTVNALGTVNVLEACRATGISQFILMSSLTVHGAGETSMTESSPYAPRHPYAASKVAAELAAMIYSRCYSMRIIILRPTLVVGEGYKEPHALGDFVETVLRGGDIVIFGNGSHRRDFVHPEDVAHAVLKSVEMLTSLEPASCEIFNISSGHAISMSGLADLVISVVGRGRKVFGPATEQAFSLFTGIERAVRLLNWKPQVGTEEIVRRVAKYLRQRG